VASSITSTRGSYERLADLRLVEVGAGETDVVQHVTGEEEDVLLDEADRAAQGLEVPFAHVDAIDEDAPGVDIIKARQQFDDGGFA
jgi:hypothetical protein